MIRVNHWTLNDGNFFRLWSSLAFSYLCSYISYRFTHTNNREGEKLVDFKAISSGHTPSRCTCVCWSPDCVVTLKKTDFLQVVKEREIFDGHFIWTSNNLEEKSLTAVYSRSMNKNIFWRKWEKERILTFNDWTLIWSIFHLHLNNLQMSV